MKFNMFECGYTVKECIVCKESHFQELMSRKILWPTRKLDFEMLHSDHICVNCGFVFSINQPSEDFLKSYYQNAFFYEDTNLIDYDSQKRINLLNNFLKKEDKVLELGSNNGSFIKELNKAGYSSVDGDDFLNENAAVKERKYDAIISYYLFEHLTKPEEFLTNIKKLLNPNGFVVIELPDFENYPNESLNHEHFFHYSKDHLIYLMNENGFKFVGGGADFKSRYFGQSWIFQLSSRKDLSIVFDVGNYLNKYFSHIVKLIDKKKYFLNLINKIENVPNKKTIAVWGMNEIATDLAPFLEILRLNVICIDKNSQKLGRVHKGFKSETLSPEKMEKLDIDIIFIAASAFESQIKNEIECMPWIKKPIILK